MCISSETSELDQIWENYKEEQRKLQKHLDSIDGEIYRLSNVYEECRSLWIKGDFQLLSETLDKEGCRFSQHLSKKLVWLKGDANAALRKLDENKKDFKDGIVCPKCDGIGKIVIEKRYERLEKQIIPVVRTQECPLCKGARKLASHGTSENSPF